MEPTTDTAVRNAPPENREQKQKPLPATDKDLRWKTFAARNPRWRIILVIGGLLLIVGVVLLWCYFSSYESTDDAQIDGHLNPISARVSGHVEKLLVEDNQYVEAGTPLVQIDPKDYQVAVERARAYYADAVATAQGARVNVPITSVGASSQVSSAQAEVENTRSGIAAARQQYESAKAQLAQAEANNVKAQNDLGRYKQLVEKQEISQQQYDQAIANAKASAAGVDSAGAAAAAAQQQIKQAESKLEQAQAGVRNASTAPQQVSVMRSRAQSAQATAERMKAELEQAELNLRYTIIKAPVSGVVTQRTVEVGQNVVPGQELMKIVPLDDIWVTANFKENQLNHIRPGQAVTISVDAYGKKYKGHVQSVSGTSGAVSSLLPPENATGNYVKVVQRVPVKVTFDPGETKEHILRPGMSVEPKVWIR
jgi:membrane fusion protein (multidrug efflux system)